MALPELARRGKLLRYALLAVPTGLVAWAGLRCLSWSWWQERLLDRGERGAACPVRDERVIRRQARAVERVATVLPWMRNCLVQAITLWLMAGRRRRYLAIYLGARQTADGFTAHAWINVNMTPVLGGYVDNFVHFDRA